MTRANVKVGKDTYMTQMQTDLQNVFQDPEKILIIVKLLRNDFDVSDVIRDTETKVTRKTKDKIERKSTKMKSSNSSTGRRKKVFPNKVKVIKDNITGETRADQMVLLKNDIEEASNKELELQKKYEYKKDNKNIKTRAISYGKLADKWIEFNGENFNFTAENISFTNNEWKIKD